MPADKLKAAAVICGLGKADMGSEGMTWLRWIGYKYAYWIPTFVLRWFWNQDPGARMDLSPEKHYELLYSYATKGQPHEREAGRFNTEESVRLWVKTSRECFKNGIDAVIQGSYQLAGDWGFRIEDIRKDLPVRLWYGNFDPVAPVSHGKVIATRIGKNAHLRVEDETHGSMFANQSQAYLTDLVNCVKGIDDRTS